MALEKAYTILVVDDAKDTQILLEFDLVQAGCQVELADSGEQALTRLNQTDVDLILLDMYMPGMSGLVTLQTLKEQPLTSDIPVIMLSASDNENEVVAALECGATDYVVKPYVAKVLLARMGNALRLREKTQQLEYLAKTDFLTGLNNRGCFFELSAQAISMANRASNNLVVAMLDIDHFKQVNDNYGHDIGDKVLKIFSELLTQSFRDYDIIGRIGGEEFALCLPNTDIESAYLACERFRQLIAQTDIAIQPDSTKQFSVTVSIGLTKSDGDFLSVDELLKQADHALYFAKSNGRNQVVDASMLSDVETPIIPRKLETINSVAEEGDFPLVSPTESVLSDEITEIDFLGIDSKVGMSNVLDDRDLFIEILQMFYQDHYQDADKLKQAIQSNNDAETKHLAHTLKGVACSVGAMELFDLTKALDIAVNNNENHKFMMLYQALAPELNRVMDDIKVKLM